MGYLGQDGTVFMAFFGPILGTVVKNVKGKKVVSGIYHQYLGPSNAFSQNIHINRLNRDTSKNSSIPDEFLQKNSSAPAELPYKTLLSRPIYLIKFCQTMPLAILLSLVFCKIIIPVCLRTSFAILVLVLILFLQHNTSSVLQDNKEVYFVFILHRGYLESIIFCIRIWTGGGIYGKIWPEPEGLPECNPKGSGLILPYIPT